MNPSAAIAWFRERLPLTETEYRALAADARRLAFTVSGLATLDLVQDVMGRLQTALEKGESFETWRTALPAQIAGAWGQDSAFRLKTIFDTNLQSAYGAGRWKAANAVRDERPYGGLEVVLDGRTSPICLRLVGVILPLEELEQRRWIPPLHFRCRTALVTYSREQAARRGVTQKIPQVEPLESFGNPPTTRDWRPDPSKYDPQLWAAYQRLTQPPQPLPGRPTDAVSEVLFGGARPFDLNDYEADRVRQVLTDRASDISSWLGLSRDLELEDLLDAAGIPNDSEVRSLWASAGRDRITVSIEAGNATHGIDKIERTFTLSAVENYVHNDYFIIDAAQTGGGLGARIFAHQVARAARLGFSRIETLAARGPSYNGYITWPTLGYDAPLDSTKRDVIERELGQPLPGWVTTLLDVFAVPGGAQAWRAVGYSTDMVFDLDRNSLSWRVLEKYMERKGYLLADGWV